MGVWFKGVSGENSDDMGVKGRIRRGITGEERESEREKEEEGNGRAPSPLAAAGKKKKT